MTCQRLSIIVQFHHSPLPARVLPQDAAPVVKDQFGIAFQVDLPALF